MPTGLPTTSPTTMPSATGSVSASRQPAEPADRDAGGEEREHRHRDAGRQRPEAVLEVLGQPGAGVGPPARRAEHRHGEAEQHPGDGGVHAGGVHQHPGRRGQRAAAATRTGPAAAPARRTAPSGTSASSSGSGVQVLGVEDAR